MIQHTVAFRLRHPLGSAEENLFIDEARRLRDIPGVIDFRIMRQIGSKNNFSFGLSMYFGSEAHYRQYNDHPDHQRFVKSVWLPQVEDFLEIDYTDLD